MIGGDEGKSLIWIPGEPTFTLIARDITAPALIRQWACQAFQYGDLGWHYHDMCMQTALRMEAFNQRVIPSWRMVMPMDRSKVK